MPRQEEERQPLLNDQDRVIEEHVDQEYPRRETYNSIKRIKRLSLSLLVLFVVLSTAVWLGLRSIVHTEPPSGTHPQDPSPGNGKDLNPWDEIRLPDWIRPSHYQLWLETDLEKFKYWGNVSITFDVVNASSSFVAIHQVNLDVKFNAFKSLNTSDQYTLVSTQNKTSHEQLVYVFDKSLKPGSYQIHLAFSGTLKDDLEGFYFSQFPGVDGETHYLATTQFEPVNARRAFPCFDEPDKKAVFDISIIANKAYHALSNMPVAHVQPIENHRRVFTFHPTVRMASYLVAFIISDFQGISTTTSNGINITVYTRPHATHLGKYALETAAHVMDFYQQKYGIDFPLPKCDFIAIPDFSAGAMENWGLITFRDTALLYDPEASDANNKKRVATVIAHELAHQWFGNLVTMRWWSDLWLNEGFAEFMEYKGTDAVEPSWQMQAQFVPSDLIRALDADDSLFTHSIAVPVKDPAEISNIFDDISYGKGSSVLRMLEEYLERTFGSSYFFARLHKYLSDHAYSNAETKELWDALGSSATNVSRFMSTWTDQPGLPLLSISDAAHSAGNYSVHLSQERFLFANLIDITQNLNLSDIPVLQRPPKDIEKQLWAIPFSYTPLVLENGKIRRLKSVIKPVEFYQKELTVPIGELKNAEKVFVLADLGRTGVYRIQYTKEAYALLGEWLLRDVTILTPTERAGFVSDVFALLFSGRLEDVHGTLDFLRFLEVDENPVVWDTALSELKTLKKVFALTDLYGHVTSYIKKLMDKIIDSLGWIESTKAKDQELRSMIRGPIYQEAVRLGHPVVVKKALELFESLKDKTSFIDAHKQFSSETLAAILDAGVTYGDEDAYQWVLDQYKASTFASDQLRFLNALASTRDPSLQTKTLNLALTGQVRRQDLTSLITRVAVNTPIGHLTTWLFLMEHWSTFAGEKGGGDFSKFNDVLQTLVSRFTNPFLIQEAERLFLKKESKDFFVPNGAVVSVVKGLERSKQLLAWREKAQKDIKGWFDQNVDTLTL